MNEETYGKTLIRLFDTLRGDEFKGQNTCHGVACKDCPFNVKDKNENKACLFDTIFNIIENWSEEHPQKDNEKRDMTINYYFDNCEVED